MIKAKNINELVQNLNINDVITQADEDFYVPVYEDILQKLRLKIISNPREVISYYVAGQSGTGKTSALNFFPEDQINEKYKVIYLYGREFLDLGDIDIIDILLFIAFSIVESCPKLEKKFEKKISELAKFHEGSMSKETTKQQTHDIGIEAQAEISAGIKFLNYFSSLLNFKTGYKFNRESRIVTRTVFNPKANEFKKLLNDIIDGYYEEFGTEKKLLIIVDDLDKMRDINQISKLFVEDLNLLQSISCTKIFAIPVHIPTNSEFRGYATVPFYFAIKLKNNPLSEAGDKKQDEIIKHDFKLLRDVILCRCDKSNLIDTDALNEAIVKSGGILRQYLQIIQEAGYNAMLKKAKKITINDIDAAVKEHRGFMSLSVIGKNKIDLLSHIAKNHRPNDINDELFIKELLGLHIIVHRNNDSWYDVNPLIEETVQIYSAPSK